MNINKQLNNIVEELSCLKLGGTRIVEQLTTFIDKLIIDAYEKVTKSIEPKVLSKGTIAIISIGGYGRREITAYSDVDIMVIAERRDRFSEEIAKAFLYHLWDLGMNISHSFRTLEECLEDAMKDITIRTSLMSSRFLIGDPRLFEIYRTDIYQKIVLRNRRSFIYEIIREVEKRHKKSGYSTYLLEPDIKEGKGGLRDIHTIRWLVETSLRIKNKEDLSKILSKKDYFHLTKAYDFLLRVRVCLHTISRRRNDIISFELQEPVAEMMSIKGTKKHHASEILMRLYYKKASYILNVLSRVIYLCTSKYIQTPFDLSIKRLSQNFFLSKNEIIIKNKEILRNIDIIFEAFYNYANTGKRFSYQLKSLIHNKAILINRKNISSKISIRYFIEILKGDRVYETLRQMHDAVVLDRFIPEFGRLRHLVIHEPYHKYTVDEHTLIAIKNLQEIKNTKNEGLRYLKGIFYTIRQEILFLALLLHDIGKGISPSVDKRHEEKSYKIIKNILERFDLPAQDRHRIEFLVKNHILLSKLALNRDIDAPETITTLCEIVENEENLNYLLLMTYADISAVNPNFWTDWKAYLLFGLINKAKKHLQGIPYDKLMISNPELNDFVKDMPKRYLLSNTNDEIEADYQIIKGLRDDNISISINSKADGTTKIIIATFDLLGLFSRIVRVLSSKGLNIVRARLYTSASGIVLDKIIVSNWNDIWWEGIEIELKDALERGIFQRFEGFPLYKDLIGVNYTEKSDKCVPSFRRFGRFVEIDNEVSSEYTLLEIASPDRLGLLYDISSRLYMNKIDIISAIINTEQGIAQDVFYIQCEGAKLDFESILKVLNSLNSVIYQ